MKKINLFLISALIIVLALTSFSIPGDREVFPENPIKVTVIYNHPEDPDAFEEYYNSVHAGLAEKVKGISRMELTKFEKSAEGESPVYYRMAELYFPSVEAMQASLNSPEGKATLDDIQNFATGGITVIHGKAEDFKFKD